MKDQEILQRIGNLVNGRIQEDWKSVEILISIGDGYIDVKNFYLDEKDNPHWFNINYELSKLFQDLISIYKNGEVIDTKAKLLIKNDGTVKFKFIE